MEEGRQHYGVTLGLLTVAGISFAISLMDEIGEPVKRWDLIRAFPVKWAGPDLKASAGELAIESLEIAHEGILVG